MISNLMCLIFVYFVSIFLALVVCYNYRIVLLFGFTLQMAFSKH